MRQALQTEIPASPAEVSPDSLPRQRLDTFSVDVAAVTFPEAVSAIIGRAAERDRGTTVCLANTHMLVEGMLRPEFRRVLGAADIVLPDGMPLAWMLRGNGRRGQERIAGMDLLPALCRAAAEAQLPVYFFGSTPETLDLVRSRLRTDFPDLTVAGMESPPFRAVPAREDEAVLTRIRRSGAAIVFVALGCPKQEIWMDLHRSDLQAVLVGIGGALDVYAGQQRRAPRVMREAGLEWVYRLWQEPRRLWKRYLVTNALFAWYLATGFARRALGRVPLGKATTD